MPEVLAEGAKMSSRNIGKPGLFASGLAHTQGRSRRPSWSASQHQCLPFSQFIAALKSRRASAQIPAAHKREPVAQSRIRPALVS